MHWSLPRRASRCWEARNVHGLTAYHISRQRIRSDAWDERGCAAAGAGAGDRVLRRHTRFRDSVIALVLPRRRTSTRRMSVVDIAEDDGAGAGLPPPTIGIKNLCLSKSVSVHDLSGLFVMERDRKAAFVKVTSHVQMCPSKDCFKSPSVLIWRIISYINIAKLRFTLYTTITWEVYLCSAM